MKTVHLAGLETPIHWQCAHDALSHAESGRKNTLTYATPEGDLRLVVELVGDVVRVSRVEVEGDTRH